MILFKTQTQRVVAERPETGRLRCHIGILPGGPQEAALWQRAKRLATTPQYNVVITGVPADAKSVWWTKDEQSVVVADHIELTAPNALEELTKLGTTHLVIPTLELSPLLYTAEDHKQYLENIHAILGAGIFIESSMSLLAIFKVGEVVNPAFVWPISTALTGDFLRAVIGEYILHDVTPDTLLGMYHRQEFILPEWLNDKASSLMTIPNLSRLREAILMWVGAHVSDVARKNNPGLSSLPSKTPVAQGLQNPTIVKLILWPLANVLSLLAVYLFWKQGLVGNGAVSIILLIPVVLTALEFNMRVAAANALMMCLGYALLVADPIGSLAIDRTEQLGTLAVLMASSVLVSWQAHRQRRRLLDAQSSSQSDRLWLRLVYDLSLAEDMSSVAVAAEQNLQRNLTLQSVFLDATLKPFSTANTQPLTPEHLKDAQTSLQNAGAVRPSASSPWFWCPLLVQQEVIGVMGVKFPVGQEPDWLALDQLFNFANLVAISLQRHRLLDNLDDVAQQMDRETLRASLLSSVSHDLKTPLVGIIGSLSTLEQVGDGLPASERHELVHSARTEAERLHHIIHNLLELTKLESGHLQPNREETELDGLISNVEKRVQRTYPGLKLSVSLPKQAEVQVDPILIEQVLYNLMDNAIKYSGQTALEINVTSNSSETVLALEDHGKGIPTEFRERVFDKFYRLEQTDKRTAGSGLGLAICRAIIRAHGGSIQLQDRADGERGLRVVMKLPHSKVSNHHKPKESLAA